MKKIITAVLVCSIVLLSLCSFTPVKSVEANNDVVAFDEVANVKFDDPQGPAMLQTYMESGNFARNNMRVEGKASMVFIGNKVPDQK